MLVPLLFRENDSGRSLRHRRCTAPQQWTQCAAKGNNFSANTTSREMYMWSVEVSNHL
jgi:hypothetical protein